eukprot:892192-Rhodomonas_salina.1
MVRLAVTLDIVPSVWYSLRQAFVTSPGLNAEARGVLSRTLALGPIPGCQPQRLGYVLKSGVGKTTNGTWELEASLPFSVPLSSSTERTHSLANRAVFTTNFARFFPFTFGYTKCCEELRLLNTQNSLSKMSSLRNSRRFRYAGCRLS